MTQFSNGDNGEEAGIFWRVRDGRKTARVGKDLVFEISTDQSRWFAVTMPLVAAALILLYENEDRLYPPTQTNPNNGRPYEGRKKLVRFLRDSLVDWRAARDVLAYERERAAARREAA